MLQKIWPVSAKILNIYYSDFRQRRIQLFSNNRMRVDYDRLVSTVPNSVVDPGEEPGGPTPPPYFKTKMRPKGPKKVFWRLGPLLLSEGLDLPLK